MLSDRISDLHSKFSEFSVSVLPDFYLDVLIDPKMPFKVLTDQINSVYSRGGGNIIGTDVKFIAGGNGGNGERFGLWAKGVERVHVSPRRNRA